MTTNDAETLWSEFRGMTVNPDASPDRLVELRVAFLSGLYAAAVRMPASEGFDLPTHARSALRSAIAELRAVQARGETPP